MKVIFDLKSLQTKLIISLIVFLVFTILYKTLPPEELNKNNNLFNLIFYSISIQTGMNFTNGLYPESLRGKILSLIQLLIGYSIYLM